MVSTYLPFDFLFSSIGALANDRKILRQMNASAIEAAACDVCSKSSSIEKSDVGSCFLDIFKKKKFGGDVFCLFACLIFFFDFGLITEKNEGIFTKIFPLNIQMLFVSIIIDVKHN